MFRHKGNTRTFAHNLKLASSLSFVAGIVNTTGVFAFATLTTNVTGHFAFFADELVKKDGSEAIVFINYILCFLFGAFISSFSFGSINKKVSKIVSCPSFDIETIILLVVSFSHELFENNATRFILLHMRFYLLWVYKSLVTKVSLFSG
jgi:uncharacterized membrane protein YoaK (UPF0700 family)